jgi:type IX secretion system PorP/SprF family membrane protein
MKTKFILFTLLIMGSVYAQQDAQFTQYMYNTININPAYAGSRGVMSAFVLHRTQWVGLDGAPVTNTASIHTPIEGSNLGVGLSLVNDRIGISDENNIAADVSYTIETSEDYKLSFGLKFTANLLSVDFNRLTLRKPGDYAISQQYNINNKFSPNIGAGIYYYSDKSYVGISAPQFLETKQYSDNSTSVATERMHFYLIAGRVFDINDEVKFKPTALTKLVPGAPVQIDLSANFLFNEKLTLGVAYRWSAAMSAMIGFQISDSFNVGYAYDLETTKLANYNSGSHEIFLRYELFSNYDKIISPRFF